LANYMSILNLAV